MIPPSTPTPNGTVIGVQSNHPVVVDHGPAWLAKLVYLPPDWLQLIHSLLFGLVVGLAILGYYRSGGLTPAVKREMIANFVTVGAVAWWAVVVPPMLQLPFLAEVLLAVGLGWGTAEIVLRGVSHRLPEPSGQ